MASLPQPVVAYHAVAGHSAALCVVRDDLLPGGTKRRVAHLLLKGASEAVYASPAEGYAQVALAYAGKDAGVPVTVFTAARKNPHPNTRKAEHVGAKIERVRPGYLSAVTKQAREYCNRNGARLLPFGFSTAAIERGLAAVARNLEVSPREVWCVAGSGTLARALGQAWPDARLHVVQIGRELRRAEIPDGAVLHVSPLPFSRNALHVPPFPSCPNYDAKAWAFITRASWGPRTLFWNVA